MVDIPSPYKPLLDETVLKMTDLAKAVIPIVEELGGKLTIKANDNLIIVIKTKDYIMDNRDSRQKKLDEEIYKNLKTGDLKRLYGSWGLTRKMSDQHFNYKELPSTDEELDAYGKVYNTDLFIMRPIKVRLLKIINYMKNLIHSALTGEKYITGGSNERR